MADIKKKLGLRISQLRADAHMIQEKLAERTKLNIDMINRIEKGDRAPSLHSLEKIAEALNVDPAELLNFNRRELKASPEGSPERLGLWNILRDKKRGDIKKILDVAKIMLE